MSEYILNLLPVTEAEKAEFEAIAPDAVHVYAGRRTLTSEQIAQATVILGWPRPKDIKGAARLKWFQTMWAGTDEYEGEGILPSGVIFTSSSGSNRQSVAEHILSFTLALCRRLPTYRDAQRDHRWEDHGAMKTIFGANVLVVGAGNIGATYAAMCRGLGAHTIGLKRTVNGPIAGFDEVFSIDRLDDLLPQADVVVLVLPHSAQTVGLMDEGRLSLMKEDAILISSGRGSVLDQEALARTMKGGRLWGAALDVTEPEPLPTDSPLWDIPNLIITPHVAGGMRLELTRRVCIQMAQDNLRRYLAGEPLKNRVR